MTVCKYRDVSERDMDLMFMEAIATDPEFVKLFMLQTQFVGEPFKVIHAQRSKVDSGLGETDITVICEFENRKHALLIENKIDAIAMPEQHRRYGERGQKGIRNREYDSFDIFIICPQRYRDTNEEAAKYEHFVSYESCRDYFSSRNDDLAALWFQQISQALETIKPEYKVDINEIAVDSFQKYAAYQKAYFPRLRLNHNPESKKVNGWWPCFVVGVPGMYILHKTNKNYVDLTISGAANKINELAMILKWLHECGYTNIQLEITGKSAAFRILTPEISMKRPFETWKMSDLDTCFLAVQELADLAMMFGMINTVIFK